MDNQSLERLMIDESVGALSPDVQVLLTDYLQLKTPEAQGKLTRWRSLARRAESAMADTTQDRPPAMAFRSDPFPILRPLAIAAVAAAMIVGLIMPLFTQIHGTAIKTHEVAVNTPASPSIGVTNFWSSQRMLTLALQACPAHVQSSWTWSDLHAMKGNLQ